MKSRVILMAAAIVGLVLLGTLAGPAQYKAVANATYKSYFPVVFRASGPCSTIPTLIFPGNGATLNTLIPVFRWDAGDCAYATLLQIELCRDPGFTRPVFWLHYPPAQGEGEFRFGVNLEPATTYYWRAWLECGDTTQGPFSDVWSFTSGPGGTILPPPTLVTPTNGSTLASLPVTFQWLPVVGAIEYMVSWARADEPLVEYYSWVTGTQHTTEWQIDSATTYEWYVNARNDYAMGEPSDTWQFTTPAGSSCTGSGAGLPHWVRIDEDNKVLFFAGASAK